MRNPGYDWAGMLDFLAARSMAGVERVDGGAYLRTVQLGDQVGWIRVTAQSERPTLLVELPESLTPVLPPLLGRLRHLFDLSARPDIIGGQLALDPQLAPAVAAHPGLRVPGAFDGFELAMRAILGQQVSVRAATTLAGRVAAAFGTPVVTEHATLDRAAPDAARIAHLSTGDLSALGVIATRARCIIRVATEVAEGRLQLEPGGDPERTIAQLVAVPGIGAWTAKYIAMRALRWPDAFLPEDLVVRKALGGMSARDAEARSQVWRPWRSYATLHLWRGGLADGGVR